jgi:tetratricopeptide (TPR) repeat protein
MKEHINFSLRSHAAAEEIPVPVTPERRQQARDFYERAMRHYMANEYEAELEELNKALELDPNHTEALFSRGCLYGGGLPLGKRDYAKALADYTRLLEVEPRNCSARHNRGLCYEQLRQPEMALMDYTRIIEGDTDFSRIGDGKKKQLALDHHYRGGVYHFSKRDYAKAVTDYTEALRLDPDIARPEAGGRIVLRRGQAYQALKQYGKAQEDYIRYQKIDPGYGELWLCWAWQLATASDADYRDGAKAVEFARKGDHNLEVLAAAYAEAGDFEWAIQTQERVLEDLSARIKPSGTPLSTYGFTSDSKQAMEARLKLYQAGRPFRSE